MPRRVVLKLSGEAFAEPDTGYARFTAPAGLTASDGTYTGRVALTRL